MIDRLNGRAAVGIAAVGLLLVVLVGWFGVVSPQWSKAAELSVQIDDAELELAATQALIDGPILRLSTAQLTTLRKAIPDELQMSEILRQLSRASAGSSVRILGITPAGLVASGGAEVVPITVAVEGRYFGIQKFLRLLRTRADLKQDKVRAAGRLFGVDAIQFAGGGTAEGGSSLIQASLTVTAFVFRGTVAAPGATTPDGTLSGVAAEPASEGSTR
ncbi:MAG: type 4a pilus biogenesis protein PilO [Gaiellaceae bacterium]